MEPRAHHILIGLFTLVSLGFALFFALWLNNSDGDRDYDWYQVIFSEGVSGLSEGSPVKYSGIRVGDVSELSLDPEDPRNVRALIRVYSHVPIRGDTRASLSLTNITGSMSIALNGGTPDAPILTGSREKPPAIVADPSALNSLMDTGEDLLAKLDRLLTNSNQVFSDRNVANLTESLANLKTLSAGLMAKREEVNDVFNRLKELTARTRVVLSTFQRVGDKADTLLETDVKEFVIAAKDVTRTLESATARLDRMVADNEASLEQGMQGIGELEPAMRDMRTTLANFNRLINRIEEDPSGLLLGKHPLQEFNP